MEKIFRSSSYSAQCLEPQLCVFLFIFRSLEEQCSYLLIAVFLCNRSIICVLVSCLRLACKSLKEVLFGLCACILIGGSVLGRSLTYLLEHIRADSAERTLKALRELVSDIFIAAYCTSPDSLTTLGLSNCDHVLVGSTCDLLEIGSTVLAHRTYKVLGKFLAHIFIAADNTSPDSLTVGCSTHSLGLWLDTALVVLIGSGLSIREDLHICNVRNEHSMCTKVKSLTDLARDIGICALGYDECAILCALTVGEVRKLVHVPARLKTEMPEQLKIRVSTYNGSCKCS